MATKKAATLRVVENEPDMAEFERVLTETAQQMAPMISRASATRQTVEADIIALRAEREGITARRDLMERMYQAVMTSFDSDLADIDEALNIRLNGVGSGAPRTASD